MPAAERAVRIIIAMAAPDITTITVADALAKSAEKTAADS